MTAPTTRSRRSREAEGAAAKPRVSSTPKPTIPPVSGTEDRPRTSIPPSLTARAVEQGILGAAMKVFARRGFAATRVEDVLEEAGVARRTFYRYFTSKEDVLAAVYEVATSELLRALDRAIELGDPMAGVDLFLDFHVENAALLRGLLAFAPPPESPLAGHRRNFRARILRLMVRAAEVRGVGPVDGFTYVGLVSALEGVALELLDGAPSGAEVGRAKRAIHGLVTSALAAPPPRGR